MSIQGILVEKGMDPSSSSGISAESGLCKNCYTPQAVGLKQASSDVRKN